MCCLIVKRSLLAYIIKYCCSQIALASLHEKAVDIPDDQVEISAQGGKEVPPGVELSHWSHNSKVGGSK